MRGRDGTVHSYYYCRNHDPLRAGGEDRRCNERNIRSDALDTFVFEQVRKALLRPDVLASGETAVAARRPVPDDKLLATELARLDRKLASTEAERRRLADLYQSDLIDLPDMKHRAGELDSRRSTLTQQRHTLAAERAALTTDNKLRHRISAFARTVTAAIDNLDFEGRQQLLRLVVEEVRVRGFDVEIQLRIPLDAPPDNSPPIPPDAPSPDRPRRPTRPPQPTPADPPTVSSKDRLRSLGEPQRRQLPAQGPRPRTRSRP